MIEDYSQPDFYRFNQDSTALINWITKSQTSFSSILDLGAGSGILGIELARLMKIEKVCLVEAQAEYLDHLKKNAEMFLDQADVDIQITTFGEFPSQAFDLIVCNPPYYLPGKGELPADPRRAIARSFILDSWEILLRKIEECLSGRCFIVLKKDDSLFLMIQKITTLKSLRHDLENVMIVELF